jgi:toxin FitB
MTYLLDTNVISESRKTIADPNFLKWIKNIPDETLHISVLSIGEIRYGLEKLPESNKKKTLLTWLEIEIPKWFGERILTINSNTMNEWGKIRFKYRSLPIIDSLLAASAITHRFTLVTRNVKDFKDIKELRLINPWEQK